MTGLGPAKGGRAHTLGRDAIITLTLALTFAGCGGSETADPSVGVSATTTTDATPTTGAGPEPEATTTSAAPPTEEPADSADVSTATVTVGDETYSYGETGFITETCNPDFFGGAQVILQLVDETGAAVTAGDKQVFLSIALIPDDPSSTDVAVPTPEPDREWIANSESLQVSGTSVDDWSIDGNRIQGTATFASTAGEGPVPGTFEVVCAEE